MGSKGGMDDSVSSWLIPGLNCAPGTQHFDNQRASLNRKMITESPAGWQEILWRPVDQKQL